MTQIFRFFTTGLVFFLVLGPWQATSQGDVSRKKIYHHLLGSSALIRVQLGKGISWGTGWVVDKKNKLLVTNHHVVGNKEKVEVLFPIFKDKHVVAEKKEYQEERGLRGKVVDADLSRDLAIVQLTDPLPAGVDELKLAADSPEPGDNVHSIGNPGASDAYWVYTSGTVRQVYKKKWSRNDFDLRRVYQLNTRIVETQSPLNPGDSGGPLVNDDGVVVGVVSSGQIRHQNRPVQLMSWCIDIQEVRAFVNQARKLLQPKTAADFTLRGQRFYDRGLYSQAIEDCSAAIKLDRKYSPAYRLRAFALCRKLDPDTAILDCNEAIRLDPDDAEAYEHRGWAYQNKGDHDRAVQDFSKAIQLDTKFARAYNNRGVTYYRQKKTYQALDDYTRAITYDASQFMYFQNRGDTYYTLRKYPEAIADSTRAVELNPFAYFAWETIGLAYQSRGEMEKSVQAFREGLIYNDHQPSILVLAGNALRKRGEDAKQRGFTKEFASDFVEALKYYGKASALNKTYAPAQYEQGLTMEKLGIWDKAQPFYREALRLQPNYNNTIKPRNRCYLRLVNNTREALRVDMQYETMTEKNGWVWFPDAPGKGRFITFNIPAGASTLLKDEDYVIKARRVRFTGQGQNSGGVWNQYWTTDLWLCRQEYLATTETEFTFTFR